VPEHFGQYVSRVMPLLQKHSPDAGTDGAFRESIGLPGHARNYLRRRHKANIG
jgi:hypothetical protein